MYRLLFSSPSLFISIKHSLLFLTKCTGARVNEIMLPPQLKIFVIHCFLFFSIFVRAIDSSQVVNPSNPEIVPALYSYHSYVF